jgi:hypothetical protein
MSGSFPDMAGGDADTLLLYHTGLSTANHHFAGGCTRADDTHLVDKRG